MKFLIAVEPGKPSQAYGVVVPDLPGCFSAGDGLEEAIMPSRRLISIVKSSESREAIYKLLSHYQSILPTQSWQDGSGQKLTYR
jgi:predicted RNase H-like HicB family nuclease